MSIDSRVDILNVLDFSRYQVRDEYGNGYVPFTTKDMLRANLVYIKFRDGCVQVIKNRYGKTGLLTRLEFKKVKREALQKQCEEALENLAECGGHIAHINRVKAYIAELKKH